MTGDIIGVTPSGRSSCTSRMRSATCWRANQMSVWSVKIAVTWENPLRDSERVLVRPGIPASAVSRG